MADQKTVDKISENIGKQYRKKISKSVNTIIKASAKLSPPEALQSIMSDETKQALQESMQDLVKIQGVFNHRAKMNGLSSKGEWSENLEI